MSRLAIEMAEFEPNITFLHDMSREYFYLSRKCARPALLNKVQARCGLLDAITRGIPTPDLPSVLSNIEVCGCTVFIDESKIDIIGRSFEFTFSDRAYLRI